MKRINKCEFSKFCLVSIQFKVVTTVTWLFSKYILLLSQISQQQHKSQLRLIFLPCFSFSKLKSIFLDVMFRYLSILPRWNSYLLLVTSVEFSLLLNPSSKYQFICCYEQMIPTHLLTLSQFFTFSRVYRMKHWIFKVNSRSMEILY